MDKCHAGEEEEEEAEDDGEGIKKEAHLNQMTNKNKKDRESLLISQR